MKAFLSSIFIIAVMVITTSCSPTKTTPEAIAGVTKQVEGKDYTIDARYMRPLRGKQIYLNSSYELRVKGDSAFAHLPYFGVAQSAPFGGGDGGIKFAEPMESYTITPNKKNSGWEISFKVNAKDYNYDIFATVFSNGNASFSVNSTNRDIISFTGDVKK